MTLYTVASSIKDKHCSRNTSTTTDTIASLSCHLQLEEKKKR